MKTYKISQYDHRAERKTFNLIRDYLKRENGETPCVLIGKGNVEGVELDAILITPGNVRILEFKDWGGEIVAGENGPWLSDGRIIAGGANSSEQTQGKNPFEQTRINRSRISACINRIKGSEPNKINWIVDATVIFSKKCSHIDITGLSDTVKKWLTVCDTDHLDATFKKSNNGKNIDEASLVGFSERLLKITSIEQYEDVPDKDKATTVSAIYEPETATELYEELGDVLTEDVKISEMYGMFSNVFHKILDQNTAKLKTNFSGPYPKTSYLLNENEANGDLQIRVHDTRVRLRKFKKMTEEELRGYWNYDLKNLCEFIELVYKIDIPKSLSDRFPKVFSLKKPAQLLAESVRMQVSSWDEECFYGKLEETDNEQEIKVPFVNDFDNKDWSYLKKVFWKDCQVNLVQPRNEGDGRIRAELIIFEPDWLVDVSTIASCFEEYAESPFVGLIKRFQPGQQSHAITLGNFAGQLLDEAINFEKGEIPYAESINTFYKGNAIKLMCLPDKDLKQFHDDAKQQKANIERAVYESLPESRGYKHAEGMVEPSFFSEMLGIQGRIDYLQLDFKLLLEQKSGKGGFPYDNFVKPRYTTQHYVQMLLYALIIRYNYREKYEANGKNLYTYLLYSKYEESLLNLSFAPDLIFRAIRLRNEMVWQELLYAKGGYGILDDISADDLNKTHTDSKLWNDYKKPEIEAMLATIQQASQLEKEYFFRFLSFVANEHLLSKIGKDGFSAKWTNSLEDKLNEGNICTSLQLIYPDSGTKGEVVELRFKFNNARKREISNFRQRDIVVVYPYNEGEEPDLRKTIVVRGKIAEIGKDGILVRLNTPQTQLKLFLDNFTNPWAIEHDFMESSYASQYRGLYSFLAAPEERRDLVLLQRPPRIDETIKGLSNKNHKEDFKELALRIKQAQDLFLIVGPPGTGKTSYGLMTALNEELATSDSSVLLMAYTNRAVDEICDKLHEADIEFIRVGKEFDVIDESRDRYISNIIDQSNRLEDVKREIVSTRVFVGTTTAINSNNLLFKIKQFSLAIIDEAAQILEPHLLPLLSAQENGKLVIQKFVMIGDHKQLPAVVRQPKNKSRVDNGPLNGIFLKDCRSSLFERLYRKYGKDKAVTYILESQGRMHTDIATFPDYAFYGNRLKVIFDEQKQSLPSNESYKDGLEKILKAHRISFIAVQPAEKSSLGQKVNLTEADIIAKFVLKIYELNKDNFKPEETVGVIVPYRNQIDAVRKAIEGMADSPEVFDALKDITIETVERYQGSQRRHILFGFTAQSQSQLEFLTDNVFEEEGYIIDRKLNVAMTRARESLIMVGNPLLLANNYVFYKLILFAKVTQNYFEYSVLCKEGSKHLPQDGKVVFDPGQIVFTLPPKFEKTFNKFVIDPIKTESGAGFPALVFGHDVLFNMEAIGYGKSDFTKDRILSGDNFSVSRQVLLYCYYLMRFYYCGIRKVYADYEGWINRNLDKTSERVRLVDVGNVPATGGLAFGDVFKENLKQVQYASLGTSASMRNMGRGFLVDVFGGDFSYKNYNALDEITFNDAEPTTVIINLAYFFSNVLVADAENLAKEIKGIMETHAQNTYLFFILNNEIERELIAYKVFLKAMSDHVEVYKRNFPAIVPISVQTKQSEYSFYYTILIGKPI